MRLSIHPQAGADGSGAGITGNGGWDEDKKVLEGHSASVVALAVSQHDVLASGMLLATASLSSCV
jgi:hypothetical protein